MGTKFTDYFRTIKDPRIERKKLHLMEDIIGLTVIAVICGAEGWEAIEEFGRSKKELLEKIFALPNGIPSHDTIERLFQRINIKEFERSFIDWSNSRQEKHPGKIINVDGKTLRGSRHTSKGKRALHMVSAWSEANRMVLGQIKTDDKSNEITAIPQLLSLLDIEESIITIDAMGCQKEIAHQIKEQKADYILAVKNNQPALYEEVNSIFHIQKSIDTNTTLEKNHGRIEERTCSVIQNLKRMDEKENWDGIQSIIKVEVKRQKGEILQEEIRFYISSVKQSAEFFNTSIRQHWSIENGFHWVLDVAFQEDHSQKRHEKAAANFAIVRRIAFNLLRQDKSFRLGMQNKRLKAAWDNEYLLKILNFNA